MNLTQEKRCELLDNLRLFDNNPNNPIDISTKDKYWEIEFWLREGESSEFFNPIDEVISLLTLLGDESRLQQVREFSNV